VAGAAVLGTLVHGQWPLIRPVELTSTESWVLRGLGLLGVFVGFTALTARPRRRASSGGPGPGPARRSLGRTGLAMGLVTFLVFMAHPTDGPGHGRVRSPFAIPDQPSEEDGGGDPLSGMRGDGLRGRGGGWGSGSRPGQPEPQEFTPVPQPGFFETVADSLWVKLVLFAAFVALTAVVFRRRRHRLYGDFFGEPIGPREAEAGLEASLAEVITHGGSPRGQVTAAYHRLLSVLAQAGAPRRPEEAPHEHLSRTLGPLGIRPEPLHALADLYVLAQFSERPVDDGHRRSAAEALEASLADLRARIPSGPDPREARSGSSPSDPVPSLEETPA